jgi:hypothetical protein
MHIMGMRTHNFLHSHDTRPVVYDAQGHGHSHGLDEEPSGGRHIATAQVTWMLPLISSGRE